MNLPKEEKIEKIFRIVSIFAIVFCCLLLFPYMRNLIIEITEKVLGRNLKNHSKWLNLLLKYSLYAIFIFSIILTSTLEKLEVFYKKYGKHFFIITSTGIIVMSVIVRIIMYIKCRSLWFDEAMLAHSIVTRNWFELLVPPLLNMQSAPVLYVIAVKAICSFIGYSEFSLRVFSLFSFFGLLLCEIILLKKAFNLDNYRIAFVVVVSALLPGYIWYSNELKPYMGDAFFVVFTILLYYFYMQEKIKLPLLSVLYILVLGFSSPALFFIGGILFNEFLFSAFNKNKKLLISTVISGIAIIAVFGLYYYWWMLPVLKPMQIYWDRFRQYNIKGVQNIFSPGYVNSDSSFVKFFVPFALMGFFSLSKLKNKIACSVILSLFFAFLASALGYWPLSGRLWLFLPVIVLIFTPLGIDFIHDKIKIKKVTGKIEFIIFLVATLHLSIGCLGYTGDKMYFPRHEINPLICFVQRNIKEDEKLYIYPEARSAFDYKNGYTATKIGNVSEDNILYGKNRDEWNEAYPGDELQLILKYKKTYLIFSHYLGGYWGGIENGLAVLRNYGTLTEIMNVHDTPLYYFEKAE